MGFNELFTGLQQNTVDGQENPPSLIYASKFQEVQKYLSVTEHVNNFLGFIMNKDFYDGLTQEQQQIVTDAAAEFVKQQRQMELDDTNLYIDKLEEEGIKQRSKRLLHQCMRNTKASLGKTYSQWLRNTSSKYEC